VAENQPLVGIVMGNGTDLPVMAETAQTLKKFGVPFEIDITSAKHSPAPPPPSMPVTGILEVLKRCVGKRR